MDKKGLTVYEFELAVFLYNNNHQPETLNDSNLEDLRKDFTNNLTKWKSIHPDFDYSLQLSWEEKGFGYESCKEWTDVLKGFLRLVIMNFVLD